MPRTVAPVGTFGKITTTGHVESPEGRKIAAPDGVRATTWRARTRFRDTDGKTRQVERWASTKAKAEATLKAALTERQAPVAASGGLRAGMTMTDAGRAWIEQNEYADLSPKTRKQYADEFERYVVGSALQGLTLREANDVGTIERFLQSVADRSGTAASKAARRVLSNLLGMAVRHKALPYSASRDVRQPKPKVGSASVTRRAAVLHDTDRAFTRAEREKVLNTADAVATDDGEDVADLIAFLAGTGARLWEALACTSWEDVALDAVDAEGQPAPVVRIRGTKTDKADRTVPLPPWLAERLRERANSRWSSGLVFGSPRLHDKTKPREKRNITRLIRQRMNGAGMPWATSHTFRRTVATWMDEAGAPLAEIANQLGHTNVNVTATYLGRRQGSNRAASVL